LGRAKFAAHLAANIRAWDGRDSLVIALQGGWGTGKTSVKNMVLEHLRANPSRCPQIVEFSPWQVSGTGTLAGNFFQELGSVLGLSKKRGIGVFKKLSAYAKHLTLLGQVAKPIGTVAAMADPATGVMIAAGGLAAEHSGQVMKAGAEASKAADEAKAQSLADLKRDLGSSLALLDRSILVVIDDIDRLTTEEILQVFQLIKANADFPNLIYLLLFERSIVEKALDRVSGDRGHEFLQKIVQVDFHIPLAHRKSVEKMLFTGLDALLQGEAIQALLDRQRWSELYLDGVSRYFQNLRHVYRFLGSFGFHVAQFKSGQTFEVNPVDLIGLEVLRVFDPGLYEQLPSMKRILTRDERRFLFGGIKQDEVEAGLKQLLTHAPPDRQVQAKKVIDVLFPPISVSFDNDRGVSGSEQGWLRQRRVCHVGLFDKYFALVAAEGDLSQADLDRLLGLTGSREGFVTECRALLKRQLLGLAFERLDAYKEQVPLENMPALIRSLCDLWDEFPEPEPGPFQLGPAEYTLRLVYFGLHREPDEGKRLQVLREAFMESRSVSLPLRLVSFDQRTEEREQKAYDFLATDQGLRELKELCVTKIKLASGTEAFRSDRNFRVFLSTWFAWGDKSEVRAWVGQHVQDADGALWLLRQLLGIVTSTGVRGTEVYKYIHLGFLEQFFPVNEMERLTSGSDPAHLQGDDKVALLEFRKALKRRAEGRPDDDWRREI
jgi:predicted KAP-like P-loop ATPase